MADPPETRGCLHRAGQHGQPDVTAPCRGRLRGARFRPSSSGPVGTRAVRRDRSRVRPRRSRARTSRSSMLPDPNVVEKVLTDPAVLDALAPGTTVVDMSSSEPERTRALAQVVANGCALVDAPVSGGVRRAESGELAIMVGGERRDIDRVSRCSPCSAHDHAGPSARARREGTEQPDVGDSPARDQRGDPRRPAVRPRHRRHARHLQRVQRTQRLH